MPLGNLTSQFFANVYLNELDQFVKHKLKIKHYIRYVDDFVILHHCKSMLDWHKGEINHFLKEKLLVGLHPDKTKIIHLHRGVNFLGFRIFSYHRLLKKSNIRKMRKKFGEMKGCYANKATAFDDIYDYLEGWLAYAKQANTYGLRKRFAREIEGIFQNEFSTKEFNRLVKKVTFRISHLKI